jgi:hypothetical protein
MKRLITFTGMFVEDVNKEDSVIIDLFGNILNFLFKMFLVVGVPFFIYVLLKFAGLF